jgi:hypothetical protein
MMVELGPERRIFLWQFELNIINFAEAAQAGINQEFVHQLRGDRSLLVS